MPLPDDYVEPTNEGQLSPDTRMASATRHNSQVLGNIRNFDARLRTLSDWIAVAFSAGDYTADTQDVSHIWTVESADVLVNRYLLIEDTLMIWTFVCRNTTTSGGPVALRCKIPGGRKSAAGPVRGHATWNTNSAGEVATYFLPDTANQNTYPWLEVWRSGFVAFPNVTNQMVMGFTAMFEVQSL